MEYGTLSVVLCRCNKRPSLLRLEQNEESLLKDVLPRLQSFLNSQHCDDHDHEQHFDIDDNLRLDVYGPFGKFTLRAVVNLKHENSGLERNAYVSDMMQEIWGQDAPSFYGTVIWFVSCAKEDMDGNDVDVVFNIDEPFVGSFKQLISEWKRGR